MRDFARRPGGVPKVALVATLGILSLVTAVSNVTSVSASTGIGVFVGYADSLRADIGNFPTPWSGSPNVTFRGCLPGSCEYDAGAVRIVNNSGGPVTVNDVKVHISTCTYSGWGPATLTSGSELIVTQLTTGGVATGCPANAFMDTSDVGPNGTSQGDVCTPDGLQPTVEVTINGQTTTHTDSGQVLNTGGIDAADCPKDGIIRNESIQWTVIGSTPCKGSVLSLTPPTQTHGIGTTATVTATFTNGCAQPLQNVSVQFAIISGPNNGRTANGVTDANGHAPFSYSSAVTGTDTHRASITNLAGTIQSNTVIVIWLAYAPGGGAFVISDRENVQGGPVYWWGAQWWKKDPLSTGLAPAAFKGYEKSNLTPWCGQTWTTRPGNSPPPPRTVPVNANMLVIVSAHVTQKGPVISGDIVHIVLVRTNAGYAPNPGHPGTGTIVSTIC